MFATNQFNQNPELEQGKSEKFKNTQTRDQLCSRLQVSSPNSVLFVGKGKLCRLCQGKLVIAERFKALESLHGGQFTMCRHTERILDCCHVQIGMSTPLVRSHYWDLLFLYKLTWFKQNISHTSYEAHHYAGYTDICLCDTILQTLQQMKNLQTSIANVNHLWNG